MNELGSPPEIDPDIAQIQARGRGLTAAQQAAQLPVTAFVAALNGQGGNITLGAGTIDPGITATFSNGVGTVSLNLTGFGALATVKCNLTAVIGPTVNDDNTQGYGIGSVWIEAAIKIYMCTDPTAGAAAWVQIG